MTMPVSEMVRLAKIRLEPIAGEEALQQARQIIAAVIGAEPAALAVHARYTRRGGLDINPFRSSGEFPLPANTREIRQ